MNSETGSKSIVIDEQNPWPGLIPFDETAQRFFNGRETESAELLRLVGLAPLTVLYGKSGLGKTSLLLAGLFPRLRQQNILPVYVRLDMRERSAPLIQQAATVLQADIGEQCSADSSAPSAGESLWEYLHGLHVQWWSHKNQPLIPLFVFDQFEEAFTLGAENADAIERLRLDLANLIENRLPAELSQQIERGAQTEHLDLRGQRYKVLLSFREDFLPEVEGWKDELPSLMRNRLRLRPMSAERALQVVSGITPAGRTHELVSEETSREIVRFVAAVQTSEKKIGQGQRIGKATEPLWDRLEIEPALLSMVCAGLNEKRKLSGQSAVGVELLKETGKAIIGDFYLRCMVGVPVQTQRFIENSLISEGGFRNSYPLQDAVEQGLLTENLLRKLVDRRLLRVEHQLGTERVELIHDRLTDAVREYRDRERELAEQQVRRKKHRRWLCLWGAAVLVLGVFGVVVLKLWLDAQRALYTTIAIKLPMQSRTLFESPGYGTPDIALLLAAAGFQMSANNETYGALQYALNETPGLTKVAGFGDPVLAVTPDRQTVVTVREKSLRLWDVVTGKPRGIPLEGHTDFISVVAISPDGRTLVSGGRDQTLRLWDAVTGQPRGVLQGHGGWISSVAFSPDGRTVVSGSRDQTLRLWDAATGQLRGAPMQGHEGWVTSVAISPDGRTVVSGSGDKTLRLWDVATGQPRRVPLQGHREPVTSVAFSTDGRLVVSGSRDKNLRLWDVATGQPRGVPWEGHDKMVSSVAFSPDNRTVASGSDDKTLRVWNVATGQPIGAPLQGHTGFVSSVAFSSDGRSVISCSYDHTFRQWDVAAGRLNAAPLLGHDKPVMSVAFSPDGKIVASGSSDWTVRLWDLATHDPLDVPPLSGHRDSVTSVAFSPDSKTMVSGSLDARLRLWDVATGQSLDGPLRGHANSVASVAFSSDGRTLVSGSWDGKLGLWDVAARKLYRPLLEGHRDRVTSVAISPDGKTLVSGGYDRAVRLWDVASGRSRILKGHDDAVTGVAFSPDGRTVVSGSEDGTLRLWNVGTGQRVGSELRGHAYAISSVAFSPDGRTLVSGSLDDTLRLWDVATGQPIGAPLRGHAKTVTSVAFSPDGRTLASGSWDATLRLWDAPVVWIDQVCGKVLRNLSHAEWKQYVGDIRYVKQCPGLPVSEE